MSCGIQSEPVSTSPFSALPGPQASRSTSTFALSDQSGFPSGEHIANSGESGLSVLPAEDGRIALLKELEESVESFRDGIVSKTTVISSIL